MAVGLMGNIKHKLIPWCIKNIMKGYGCLLYTSFQFNVNPDDTNRSVQDKLAKLFNTASIGIHADVKEDDSGHSALVLTSRKTGLKDDEDFLFQILPGTSNESIQAMDKLGINKVTDAASNSVFLLNGTEHSSYSNTFTINNTFEVHLKEMCIRDSNQVWHFQYLFLS